MYLIIINKKNDTSQPLILKSIKTIKQKKQLKMPVIKPSTEKIKKRVTFKGLGGPLPSQDSMENTVSKPHNPYIKSLYENNMKFINFILKYIDDHVFRNTGMLDNNQIIYYQGYLKIFVLNDILTITNNLKKLDLANMEDTKNIITKISNFEFDVIEFIKKMRDASYLTNFVNNVNNVNK